MTNGDKIRKMSDKELEELLSNIRNSCCAIGFYGCKNNISCEECLFKWLKEGRTKAWIVTDEYEEYSTVVFAETRNQARTIAQATDCCEDMDYINIEPRRFKEADARYCGKSKMEWDDPDDRRFLVEHGWSCVEPEYDDCPDCPAADICDKYNDYKQYEIEVEE